jgi:crotonobetainyl-CoA:carnitine CoA-transferase CaiB-like acyl-CoA transferase
MLAEWGAEVIRVEPRNVLQPATRAVLTRPPLEQVRASSGAASMFYRFPNRDPGERAWNRSPSFNSHARNKLGMTMDIMQPEGHVAFLRLIAVSDVFIENNVPETLERAHLTYEELLPVNAQLIMLRMPGYGLSGPYKNYRTFGSHMEGMAGHHLLRSYPDMDPSLLGDAYTGDAAAGLAGAFAVMLALRHRRRTGVGQQIELALAENFVPYLGEVFMDYTMNGRVAGPQGNSHPTHAPHNVYPCKGPTPAEGHGHDRWIAVDIATQEEWERFCAVMGDPAWAREPQFADPISRWKHREELDRHIAQWTRDKDDYDLFHTLQAAGITAGPVQNEADAYRCLQLQCRGFFEELTGPETGTYAYPGLIFKMSATPNRLRRYPVRLGEDNEYTYKQLLGYSDAEYRHLEELGHIGMDYPPEMP